MGPGSWLRKHLDSRKVTLWSTGPRGAGRTLYLPPHTHTHTMSALWLQSEGEGRSGTAKEMLALEA